MKKWRKDKTTNTISLLYIAFADGNWLIQCNEAELILERNVNQDVNSLRKKFTKESGKFIYFVFSWLFPSSIGAYYPVPSLVSRASESGEIVEHIFVSMRCCIMKKYVYFRLEKDSTLFARGKKFSSTRMQMHYVHRCGIVFARARVCVCLCRRLRCTGCWGKSWLWHSCVVDSLHC